jgi:hypothetical protein
MPSSALTSRTGSPLWKRPASRWSKLTTERSNLPQLYLGKDERSLTSLGQYGP